MTRKESEALKIGDRVVYGYGFPAVGGAVTDHGFHAVTIRWDDGQVGTIAHEDAHVFEHEHDATGAAR